MEGEEEEGDPAWEMRPIMKDYHHPQEERERVGAEREREYVNLGPSQWCTIVIWALGRLRQGDSLDLKAASCTQQERISTNKQNTYKYIKKKLPRGEKNSISISKPILNPNLHLAPHLTPKLILPSASA